MGKSRLAMEMADRASGHGFRVLATPTSKGEAMIEESPARTGDGLSAFFAARPRLFGIAYRMLGSVSDAEDVVQDAWVRWQTTDRRVVRSAPAFLATMTKRLAINLVQSARSRRETGPEPWLPEAADASRDPGLEVEQGEALELAVLLLLEKLRPRERAVFVLSEAFDYSYAQIAELLPLTEAHACQLASRARKVLGGERRQAVSAEEHRRLLEAFLAASSANDRTELEQLLASEAVGDSDGGVLSRTAVRCAAGPSARREVRRRSEAARRLPRHKTARRLVLLENNG